LRAPDILCWSIEGDENRWVARAGGEVVSASGSAALWRGIAAKSGGAPVHIGDNRAAPDLPALERAARLLEEGRGAVIGRVGYRCGQPSRTMGRIDTIRYLNTPPGAILARSDALARAAEWAGERGFDEFWAFDLINALDRTAWIGASHLQFARSAGDAPAAVPERVPFARANPRALPRQNEPLILIYGQLDASTSLYFDGLPDDIAARIRFLRPGDIFSDLPWLASASLVIVVRGFEQMALSGCAALLTEIGVPYAWFIDDDFVTLREEEPRFHFYTQERVNAFLANAAALIVTTESLAAKFSALAAVTLRWPCVYDRALAKAAPSSPGGAFRVGAFGGAFRRESFKRDIVPALAALRERLPVKTYAANGIAHGLRKTDAEPILFEAEFRSFVHRWRALELHAITHPYGDTENISGKGMASLLVAAYLGAVPIAGAEPAYACVGENEGVLKAGPSAQDWSACLARLADSAEREQLYRRLDLFCRTAFDPERARAPFEALMRLAAPGGPVQASIRLQRACQSQHLRRALLEPPPPRRGLSVRLKRSVAKRWPRLRRLVGHP
jgi:hypothetical protein